MLKVLSLHMESDLKSKYATSSVFCHKAISECSGVPAHRRSLARTYTATAHSIVKYVHQRQGLLDDKHHV